MAVLLGVGARAVAVLQVDPQVLDRFAGQLVPDACQEIVVVVEELAQEVIVLLGAAQGSPAVVRDEAGVEAVRGDVDGVHRLPSGTLAGVVAGKGGVDLSESLVELLLELTDEQPEVAAGRLGLHQRTAGASTTSSTSNPSEFSR